MAPHLTTADPAGEGSYVDANAAGFKLEGAHKAMIEAEGVENAFKTSGQIEFSLSWMAVPQAGSTPRATQAKH